MDNKIVLLADEPIVCPKCAHEFPLQEGITRQAIDRHADEFEALLRARRVELEASITAEAQRKALQSVAGDVAKLQEQVAAAKKAEREAKGAVDAAREEARAKAVAEQAQALQALQEDLAQKSQAIDGFRQQELELRRQKQALEEQQKNLELDLQRRLDEERQRLTATISQREADRFGLVEAERRKKIEDAQKANDDLRRKLEQGSQQLQGEVLELEVEQSLANSFLHDLIEEVKKGQRGADVIQTVRTPTGQPAGKIIWEAKRAENWSDKWLQKLKDDQQEARADLAVLVTTAMPRGTTDPFMRIGDVWVVSPQVLRPMAETLRVILLEAHKLRQAATGQAEKVEQLYHYLSSARFSQRVRTMLDSFAAMQTDLMAEKRAMVKIWAKRQTQIERVTHSMLNVVGELQAISQNSLPELEAIEALALTASTTNTNNDGEDE